MARGGADNPQALDIDELVDAPAISAEAMRFADEPTFKLTPFERELLATMVEQGPSPKMSLIPRQYYQRGYAPSDQAVSMGISRLKKRYLVEEFDKLRGGTKRWKASHYGMIALELAGGAPPIPNPLKRSLTREQRAWEKLVADLAPGDFLHTNMGHSGPYMRWRYDGEKFVAVGVIAEFKDYHRDLVTSRERDWDLPDHVHAARSAIDGWTQDRLQVTDVVECSMYMLHSRKAQPAERAKIAAELAEATPASFD